MADIITYLRWRGDFAISFQITLAQHRAVTVFSQKMLMISSFFVIYGMGKMLNDMYKREHAKS